MRRQWLRERGPRRVTDAAASFRIQAVVGSRAARALQGVAATCCRAAPGVEEGRDPAGWRPAVSAHCLAAPAPYRVVLAASREGLARYLAAKAVFPVEWPAVRVAEVLAVMRPAAASELWAPSRQALEAAEVPQRLRRPMQPLSSG